MIHFVTNLLILLPYSSLGSHQRALGVDGGGGGGGDGDGNLQGTGLPRHFNNHLELLADVVFAHLTFQG